jgi:hypothetical protein
MPRLAWTVCCSKDFVETKTVTGDLCVALSKYSQQGLVLHEGPKLSKPVNDNGDCISELDAETDPENRSANFHRGHSCRFSRPRKRALVDADKPDE